MKKKLYKAITSNTEIKDITKGKSKTIYVIAETMMDAASMLSKELPIEEELIDIELISEECYV